jgi:hypothetical protein
MLIERPVLGHCAASVEVPSENLMEPAVPGQAAEGFEGGTGAEGSLDPDITD